MLEFSYFHSNSMDFKNKTYGRNNEVAQLYKYFSNKHDISMHGPRRLGKTFVLDRLVDQASDFGFVSIKVEIAGCTDTRAVFQRLCEEIGRHRTRTQRAMAIVVQRVLQVTSPRADSSGNWYQPFLNVDWQSHIARLLSELDKDTRPWVVLIDELPIFLKSLHDKGDAGIQAARDFMNHFSQLRSRYPRVRWLITGSIGIEPLAKQGHYLGVIAKFKPFVLTPLTTEQAKSYVQDLATDQLLEIRSIITDAEAEELVRVVGWRSAYYLEALAQKVAGHPSDDLDLAKTAITNALDELIAPHNRATFSSWEEHIQKHYEKGMAKTAYAILNEMAKVSDRYSLEEIAERIGVEKQSESLISAIEFLVVDGFIYSEHLPAKNRTEYGFRIPILKLWWEKYPARFKG